MEADTTHTTIENAIQSVCDKYNLSPSRLLAVLLSYLAESHESLAVPDYKGQYGTALGEIQLVIRSYAERITPKSLLEALFLKLDLQCSMTEEAIKGYNPDASEHNRRLVNNMQDQTKAGRVLQQIIQGVMNTAERQGLAQRLQIEDAMKRRRKDQQG